MPSSLPANAFGYDSVIVDSNLLLLLTVGLWNPRAIETQKRLNGRTYEDFQVLRTFLSSFGKVVTTAHVLTEVSNLAGSASGQTRQAIFQQLASLIGTLDEQTAPSSTVCTNLEFQHFGLTDAALSLLCTNMLLLTEDGRLANHLQRKGFHTLTLAQVKKFGDQAKYA